MVVRDYYEPPTSESRTLCANQTALRSVGDIISGFKFLSKGVDEILRFDN